MRIEKVEIKNYRQYFDVVYSFVANKVDDLHIIKGDNGMGKTNLLNAITWCLYNKEPHLGNNNSGEPRLNKEAIRNATDIGKEEVEICVRVQISDSVDTIIFERRQLVNVSNLKFEYKSDFTVTEINENNVHTDSEECRRIVNLYMPEDIREYFFFDGEHLEKYFILEQGEKIKNAVEVISHVRLLTSMKERLQKVVNEYNVEAGKKNKDIDALVKQEAVVLEKVYEYKKIIAELKTQILLSENIIKECSDFLVGKEGIPEKEKEFQELQEEINEKNEELKSINNDIQKFIVRYKTLFGFYPAIKETYELIIEKEEEGAFPPNIDKNFLKRMLVYHKCLVCDRELCGGHDEENINKLIEKVSVTNGASHILSGIKDQLSDYLEEAKLYKEKKNQKLQKKKRIEASIEKLQEKLNKLDAELKQFSDKEKVRDMHERRIKHKALADSNMVKKARFEIELQSNEENLAEIQKQIEKARNSIKEFKEMNLKIDFATEARKIVEDIEQEMMDEVRQKLVAETMRIFTDLEWKKDSYRKIELDENYNLELYDMDGYPTVGTCSAGERALLALSFTLALQKIAGYDSMLFIDTPVGRIDSENRKNFANVLTNVAKSKQVIVTLTSSEYSKEIQNAFEPIYSSFYGLRRINRNITTIEEV